MPSRFLSLLVVPLAVACSDGPRDDASPCAVDEFLCLDRCQPLGTTCGARSDAGLDAGADHDPGDPGSDAATDPCAPRPHEGTDAPVLSFCRDGSTTASCDGDETVCNASFPDCHEWFEPLRSAFVAACLEPGVTPCDPELEPTRCEGPLQLWCNDNAQYPEHGPAGLQRQVDCRERYGDDAVCAPIDDVLVCSSPSAESCSPETHVRTCSADGGGIDSCSERDGIVYVESCLQDWRCLDNEHTRETTMGVSCIPEVAVPSDAPGTTGEVGLSCEAADVIRIEQYGWEWSQYCLEGEVCYDGPPPRCEPAVVEHCDPEDFVPTCTDDGLAEIQCGGLWSDTQFRDECSPFGQGACDPLLGQCVPSPPCAPGDPPRCAEGNRFRLTCDGELGVMIPEPCLDCRLEDGAVGCGG